MRESCGQDCARNQDGPETGGQLLEFQARNILRLIRTDPGKMLHDFWHLELVGLINVLDGRA
jgi:hypothetical protein